MAATIGTNGWDTVYATTYTNINAQITLQWPNLVTKTPNLTKITAATSNGKVSLDLTLSTWQLTQGGDGNAVCLILPIEKGSFQGLDNLYDLSGQDIIIELALEWVPQKDQIQFLITNNVPVIETDLGGNSTVTSNIIQAFTPGGVTLSPSATITTITKAVSWKISDASLNMSFYVYTSKVNNLTQLEVYQYDARGLKVSSPNASNPVKVNSAGNISDEYDAPIFSELISQNLDNNLHDFEIIFATVDVVTSLAADDVWTWLQPTTLGYAVIEPQNNPTNDNCVFAILSMVGDNENPNPVLQVDVNAIAPGCTSSLLFSPTMFLHNILAAGVSSVFTGSNQSDFTIDENNLSITNAKTLTWANVELDDGTTVSLTVNPEDFSLGVENDRINISFSNLNYPITKLDVTIGHVEIIFNAQFQLTLETGTNGNRTLWFSLPTDQPATTNVSTVIDETYYKIEEAIGIITGALSMIALGGAVAGKIAGSAAAGALVDGGFISAEATDEEIQDALKDLVENGIQFNNEVCADTLEILDLITISQKQANLFTSIAKWAGTISALTGLTEGAMVLLQSTLLEASQNKWETTPAFANFADMAIDRYSFGTVKDMDVQSVALAESMQIGFTGKA